MSRDERKVKRQQEIAQRKILRVALKDKVINQEYSQRFRSGVEVGRKMERAGLLKNMKDQSIITSDLFEEWMAK